MGFLIFLEKKAKGAAGMVEYRMAKRVREMEGVRWMGGFEVEVSAVRQEKHEVLT